MHSRVSETLMQMYKQRRIMRNVANTKRELEMGMGRYIPELLSSIKNDDNELLICDLLEQKLNLLQVVHGRYFSYPYSYKTMHISNVKLKHIGCFPQGSTLLMFLLYLLIRRLCIELLLNIEGREFCPHTFSMKKLLLPKFFTAADLGFSFRINNNVVFPELLHCLVCKIMLLNQLYEHLCRCDPSRTSQLLKNIGTSQITINRIN